MSPEEFDEMSRIVGPEFDSVVSTVAGVFPPWGSLRQAGTASGCWGEPRKGLFSFLSFFFLKVSVFKLAVSSAGFLPLAFPIPVPCEVERSGHIESSHPKGSRLFSEADTFLRLLGLSRPSVKDLH